MIETAAALDERLEEGRRQGRAAVDTELVWERTFYPALGVVQLGLSRTGCYLVDAVALEGQLQSMGAWLADDTVTKILHDAVQDLTVLRAATGASARTIFDTRIAAGFVGLLSTVSLRELLIDTVGVELDKTETRTDWLQRPLAETQIGYAEDDVRYLLDAMDVLLERARERGVEAWLQEEMATLDDPGLYQERDAREAFRRVKGYGKMRGLELAVLRELAAWRELAARQLDRPRGRVASDKLLLYLTQRQPESLEDLSEVRSFRRRDIERHGQDIVDAVRRARQLPEAEWPDGPPRERYDRAAEERCREAMERMRVRAEEGGLDPVLVATRADVRGLVRGGPERENGSNRLTGGWRWDFVGRELAETFHEG